MMMQNYNILFTLKNVLKNFPFGYFIYLHYICAKCLSVAEIVKLKNKWEIPYRIIIVEDLKLIAVSSSVQCDWVISNKHDLVFQTEEINPLFQAEEDIEMIVSDVCEKIHTKDITSVHFYGAGCFLPQKKEIVRKILSHHIAEIHIEVESDLLAAARALFKQDSGIVCVLGTGSNSGFYNGIRIKKNISPLGYIWGDEGGGAAIGKIFIGNLLKNRYSGNLYEGFMDYYKTSPREILESVYKKAFPERYLAQFTKFIAKNINEPAMYDLVYNTFSNFITGNIMLYNYLDYPVQFTGSVAFYFEDILRDACLTNGIRPGDIVQNPLKGLIEFHRSNCLKKH